MSRYARMAGRRKHPNRHCFKMVSIPTPPVSPSAESPSSGTPDDKRLVCAGSRIDGRVKIAISPEILEKTEGMGWHQRIARIHALTGIPFVEISEVLDGQNAN